MAKQSKQLIEMVCTGNQGRSPVAELIARDYIRRIGAQDHYTASSSGTLVSQIKGGNVDPGFMANVIKIAQGRGLYNATEEQSFNDAIRTGDTNTLSSLYGKACTVFVEEERRYRREVLPELGIEGIVKEAQEQTVVGNNRTAVFSMASVNNAQVEQIYAAIEHKPVIAVLTAYAFNDPTAQIPNAFGLPREVYVDTVKVIQVAVPKAIDRLLSK